MLGKRDAVMKAAGTLMDRHWHCQTPTCEKLSSLSSLLVCYLTSQGAQLKRCWEELECRGSTEAEVHPKSEESMFGRRAGAFGDTPCTRQCCHRIVPSAERAPLHPSWHLCNSAHTFIPKTWYLAPETHHYFQHGQLMVFHCAQKTNLPMAYSIPDHPAGTLG